MEQPSKFEEGDFVVLNVPGGSFHGLLGCVLRPRGKPKTTKAFPYRVAVNTDGYKSIVTCRHDQLRSVHAD